MQKKLLISVVAILILLGGVVLLWQKNLQQGVQTSPVVKTEDTETGTAQKDVYPQHIESIPGNTHEAWYGIPEIGIHMKLNKEFAEDLIYIFAHERNDSRNEEWDAVYFSTKALTVFDKGCSPEKGHPLGIITKSKGDVRELAKTDIFYSSRLEEITQIGDYYYMFTGAQAICWDPKNDEAIRRVKSAKDYSGSSGAKYISEGMKTLQLIPSK